MDQGATKRLTNFEILRILAMFFVVVYHFFSHGLHCFGEEKIYFVLHDTLGWVNFIGSELIYNLVQIAVNLYVMITGYFLIENTTFKFEKIIKIWMQMFFYSSIIGFCFFFSTNSINVGDFLKCFIPFKTEAYWFVTQYIALVALSPFIAYMTKSIVKRNYLLLLGIMCLLTLEVYKLPFAYNFGNKCGNSLLFFITLFLTGGYVKRFGSFRCFRLSEKQLFVVVYIITIVWAIAKSTTVGCKVSISGFPYHSMTYIEAVTFFQMFAKIKLNGKLWEHVASVAPYAFGVYLISDNSYLRMWIWDDIVSVYQYVSSLFFIPYAFLSAVMIMVVCMFVDVLRMKLFSVCGVDSLLKKIGYKIKIE